MKQRLGSVGDVYQAQGDYTQALTYFHKSLHIAQEIGHKREVVEALLRIGGVYRCQKQTDVALSHLYQALTIAQEIDAKYKQFECHQMLAEIYKQASDFEQALAHHEQFHTAKEEVFNEKADQRLKSLEVMYQVEAARKEAEIHRLKNMELQQEISERKRAEEQLQRYTAELEQANEELKTFTYIVSHDLRAPLTNLKGFAAVLRSALEVIGSAMDTALPHLDEKQQQAVTTALQENVPEALGFIDSSMSRMKNFVNALLKLSRLGRCELNLEPIDMDALVQATLRTLAHQIEERRAKVTVGSLPEVVADRISMEQIMGNLLTNAVLYLDPNRPGEIEVTAENGRGETTFRVRDNGRGIAEEDMDKVFAPFRRVGRQDVPGEGMGLSYVQALVRRHGGRIWCESEPGVGTTFTFTLSNHLTGRRR